MKKLILLLLVVMTLTGCGKTAQNDRETAILYTGKDHLTARETVDAWSVSYTHLTLPTSQQV